MDPLSILITQALEDHLITVEYTPELRGADPVVPAKFALYVRIGSTKVRVSEVDASHFLESRQQNLALH